MELGTSTDNGSLERQPLDIKFTPSLTYAEKLLLKRHRRMELPSMPQTSRSCSSAVENVNVLDSTTILSSESVNFIIIFLVVAVELAAMFEGVIYSMKLLLALIL